MILYSREKGLLIGTMLRIILKHMSVNFMKSLIQTILCTLEKSYRMNNTGSRYTYSLKGANAKAKANASQGIPDMLEIATGKHFRENSGEKHNRNAANGWYRYNSRFALPVYDESGEVERYNVFHASMLIRHDADGKMYRYDIMDIKKETSNPFES